PARALAVAFGTWATAGDTIRLGELRRQVLNLKCLRPRRLRAALDWCRTWVIWRSMRPFRVAVLGMDGSGKSNLIRHALSLPSPLPLGTAYLGYNEFRTPVFKWLIRRIAVARDLGSELPL